MKTMTVRLTTILAIFLTVLLGCVSKGPYLLTGSDQVEEALILAAVFKHMGDNSKDPVFFLAVSDDTVYVLIEDELARQPHKWRYERFKKRMSKNDKVMLSATVADKGVDHATVYGTYLRKEAVTSLSYEVEKRDGTWLVTKTNFLGAS